jgi:hypothetical protein
MKRKGTDDGVRQGKKRPTETDLNLKESSTAKKMMSLTMLWTNFDSNAV